MSHPSALNFTDLTTSTWLVDVATATWIPTAGTAAGRWGGNYVALRLNSFANTEQLPVRHVRQENGWRHGPQSSIRVVS